MNTVPGLSIVFMAISLIISIGLPIFLFLFWRRKYGLKLIPLLVGAAAFYIFAMVLERLLHSVVLQPAADGTIGLLKYSPLLFVLYTIFAAGGFEETARFLSFQLLKKKFRGIGTGLSYGIGHGGIEAILLAGLSLISMIYISVMINNGNASALGDSPALLAQINGLTSQAPGLFLISGAERIMALTIHISLSIIVWRSVNAKGRLWLYPVAIALHALADTPASLLQAGVFQNAFLVEGVTLVIAVLIAFAAYRVCKTAMREAA